MSGSFKRGTRRLVRCAVGGESYVIDSGLLDSVHVLDNLYPSRSDDGAIGWLRRFDEKVPVYKLADRLGKPSRGVPRDGVIMILRGAGEPWALLVDKVTGAAEVASEQFRPLPPLAGDSELGPFPAVVLIEDRFVLLLAPDRLRSGLGVPITVPASAAVPSPAAATGYPAGLPARGPAGGQLLTFSPPYEQPPPEAPRLALSATQVLEVLGDTLVVPVPFAPSFVSGLASWRSYPVPVVNLAACLGFSPAPYRPGCRLLICRTTTGGGLIAVPVAGDVRKLLLPVSHRPWRSPTALNRDLALGVYEVDRALHIVPNLNAVSGYRNTFEEPAYRM